MPQNKDPVDTEIYGWITVAIGDISEVKGGKRLPKGSEYSSTITAHPYIRVTDFNNGTINTSDLRYIEKEIHQKISRYVISKSDVYISIAGSIGISGTIPVELDGSNLTENAAKIELPEEILAKFIHYQFCSSKIQNAIRQPTISTTQPKLALFRIKDLEIGIAPIAEQTRIVTAIESFQQRSARARALLAEVRPALENLRQSILQAAFSGRLTADWRAKNPDVEPADQLLARIRTERRQRWETDQLEKFKAKGKKPPKNWKDKYKEPEPVDDSELSELPEGWCWASVEQVGRVESGQTPKGCDNRHSDDGEVPWFRVGDMNSEGNEEILRSAEITLSLDDVATLKLHVRPAGTIVFPKRGGAIATNKKRVLGQPSAYDLNTMGVVPLISGSLSGYLWWWFQSIDLAKLADGGVILQINHGDIAPLTIPVAPESEMNAIVRVLQECNDRLNAVYASVSAMESSLLQLDQSILSKAFRGELVPQDPHDEPAADLLARIRATREAVETKKKTTRKKS